MKVIEIVDDYAKSQLKVASLSYGVARSSRQEVNSISVAAVLIINRD